jgi:hypothetical protein
MNELKDTKPMKARLPGALSPEIAGLNDLLGLMNNPAITGAEVPKGEDVKVKHPNLRKPLIPVVQNTTTPEPDAQSAMPTAPTIPGKRASVSRLFFTGTIAAGKDYIASQCGAQVIGFADPIYALVNHLFGTNVSATTGKDIPGVREMLQILGQWGRGDVNPRYPLTPARAFMLLHVRGLAGKLPEELCVDWASFGLSKDIWLDSLVERAKRLDAGQRVAATNVRFENEFKRLQSEGWVHYHVLCSPATRAERLKKQGIDIAKSKAVVDESEKLAAFLDADVARKCKMLGSKLRCVWNDTAPLPSKRLYSGNEFLQELAIGEVAPETEAPAANLE